MTTISSADSIATQAGAPVFAPEHRNDPSAAAIARDLDRLTGGTYRAWRVHQGVIHATSHAAETWLAEVRLDTTADQDGLMSASGTPRIGSHASWRVRVASVNDLVTKLREVEHDVRASYAASARFRAETGRSPYAIIDDQRMQALRGQTARETFDLPF